VWLEGFGQLKKIHLIGTRTRDLPACSIVPQPTTLPRAPTVIPKGNLIQNLKGHDFKYKTINFLLFIYFVNEAAMDS
jgi:hypothetical protein